MKTPPLRITALALTLAMLMAGALPDHAKAEPEGAVGIERTAEVEAKLQRISTYLNSIRTLQSRFLQVSSTGEYAEGQFYLSRPGRVRIEYDPPNPVLIVSGGELLTYYDKELEQASHIAVENTPAAFLLSKEIAFDPEKIVVKGIREEENVISLTVAKTEDPLGGSLTLVFNAKPLTLRKWTVTDAQGIVTDLALTGPFFGGQLDPKLFEFTAPEPSGDGGG